MENIGLNRNRLKYIALIAMIIDHIAMFFLSKGLTEASFSKIALYGTMRTIGRLTAPIMIFFLVEGFIHTSSRAKYGTRLAVFGLISQVPYALAHYNSLTELDFNMIITLAVSFLMLEAYEKIQNPVLNRIVVFALIMLTFCCDWGVIGPLMAWLFYRFRNDRRMQLRSYAILCLVQVLSAVGFLAMNGQHWYGELWQAGMFLVIPFLLSYNGERGSDRMIHKWIFYIMYPLHLLIIWIIKFVI